MNDKLGINIVGAVDHSTRLYNRGEGFRAMTGNIGFGSGACIYLGFTAERAYTVAVEGDLTVSTETSDSRPMLDGVYGFDVDWTEAARFRGFGSGKIVISNPDVPGAVSVFEVRMEETPSVKVTFAKDTGTNVRVVLGADTDLSTLDRGVVNTMLDGEPLVDSEEARRLEGGSGWITKSPRMKIPAGATAHPIGDLWGGDVSHLRRNILT